MSEGDICLGTLSVLGPQEAEAWGGAVSAFGIPVGTLLVEVARSVGSGPSKTSVLALERQQGGGCLSEDWIQGPLCPFPLLAVNPALQRGRGITSWW